MKRSINIKSRYASCWSAVLAVIGSLAGPTCLLGGVFVVTNLADSFDPLPGTLREAIANASVAGGGDIVFSNVTGTIVLFTKPLPTITNNINILGPGACQVSISTGPYYGLGSLFTFDGEISCSISGLCLSNGYAGSGGAISSYGSWLFISDCSFVTNRVFQQPGQGGAVYAVGGVLTCSNCAFVGNQALVGGAFSPGGVASYGGAIYEEGTALTVADCSFAGNSVTGGNGAFNNGIASTGGDGFGGAVFCCDSAAAIWNCTFSGNNAAGGYCGGGSLRYQVFSVDGNGCGGAVAASNCVIVISGCALTANSAAGLTSAVGGGLYGGAIYQQVGTMTLLDSSLQGNTALGIGGYSWYVPGERGLGGAVYNLGTIVASNCAFSGNEVAGAIDPFVDTGPPSPGSGGAICNLGVLSLQSCQLTGNTAQGGAGQYDPDTRWLTAGGNGLGGAVFNGNRLAMVNCLVAGNSAYGGAGDSGQQTSACSGLGGGVFNTNIFCATNSTFSGNSATGGNGINNSQAMNQNGHAGQGDGGGIHNSGTLTAFNVTLTGNSALGGVDYYGQAAGLGGGICSVGTAAALFDHLTIAANTANTLGGIYNGAALLIKNTILSRNWPMNYSGPVMDAGYNISSDSSCLLPNAGSLMNTDPMLGPLADNGGPTWTMALLPGSPAIDQGSADGVFTDQRGLPRPSDFPEIPDANDGSDIGAFELQAPQPAHCVPAPSGIIGWWPGEGDALDVISANLGTMVGGVSFAPGKVGQAFSFNGVDGAINLGDPPALKLTNSLTIEGWIFVKGFAVPSCQECFGHGQIIFRGDDRAGLDPYSLSVETNSGGVLRFHVDPGTFPDGANNLDLDVPVPTNEWLHVAATLDTSAQLATLYINGEPAAQTSCSVHPFGDLDSCCNPGVGIGNNNAHPYSLFNMPFNGLIDELSIYNRALTTGEVYSIYAAGSAGKCYPGTSAYPAVLSVWGDNSDGQSQVPSSSAAFTAIAAGDYHSLALTAAGQVVGWGQNDFGQTNEPDDLTNAIAIGAGWGFSLAVRSDHTVTAWGCPTVGAGNFPPGMSNILSVAGGWNHALALRGDGTVLAWGDGSQGQTNVPNNLNGVVAIAAGGNHSLALRQDGSVVAWGDYGTAATNVPANLTNVAAIAAGDAHNLALKWDGTVVAWGDDSYGQIDVPVGLSNVVAIAAGGSHSLALVQNGNLAGWGDNSSGELDFPVGASNYVAIAAGRQHSLALIGNGVPAITVSPCNLVITPGQTAHFNAMAVGQSPLSYQWLRNESPLSASPRVSGGLSSQLTLSNVNAGDLGSYSLSVNNGLGFTVSAPGELSFVPLWLGGIQLAPGGQLILTISGNTGDVYQLQTSSNLLAWQNADAIEMLSGTVQWVSPLTSPNGACFYRLLLP